MRDHERVQRRPFVGVEAVNVARVRLIVAVDILPDVLGHGDHLIDRPIARADDIVGILDLPFVGEALVERHRPCHGDRRCPRVAEEAVVAVSERDDIVGKLRIPRLIEVNARHIVPRQDGACSHEHTQVAALVDENIAHRVTGQHAVVVFVARVIFRINVSVGKLDVQPLLGQNVALVNRVVDDLTGLLGGQIFRVVVGLGRRVAVNFELLAAEILLGNGIVDAGFRRRGVSLGCGGIVSCRGGCFAACNRSGADGSEKNQCDRSFHDVPP